MDPKTNRVVKVSIYKPFETKERETGGWNFKGKVGNAQVDEKKQTVNKPLSNHPDIMGYREE